MLFNSLEYGAFLPIIFLLYWFFFNKNLRLQNTLLLIAGYLFYGMWNWRFLFLLFLSSTVDYLVGIRLGKESSVKHRKLLLTVSIAFNVCLLFSFKYFNFFADSLAVLLTKFGFQVHSATLNVILPVGISFYTF
jgi:alginate O-acetyltransferase complex protein AlgI